MSSAALLAYIAAPFALSACAQLLGDPFHPDPDEEQRAPLTMVAHDGGANEDVHDATEARTPAAAPTCTNIAPTRTYSFSDSVEGWTGQAVAKIGHTTVEFEPDAGSPDSGALRVLWAFPALPPDGAMGARAGISGLTKSPTCIRARLKIDEAYPPPSDLTTEPASWYFWALSGEDWCFAQLLTETQKGWHKQLDQVGVWYSVAGPTAKFVSASECTFDPTQLRRIGIGFASNFREPWDAQYLVDQVELFY